MKEAGGWIQVGFGVGVGGAVVLRCGAASRVAARSWEIFWCLS